MNKIGAALLIPFVIMLVVVAYQEVSFDIAIGGHMERAANANTIELATQEMQVVVSQMESRGMTEGYTSVLYRTPDEDVGFWYNNMKSSLEELKSIKADATQLERSNVLMKLRESLTNSASRGKSKIVVPDGIVRFPNNMLWSIILTISSILFLIGILKVIKAAIFY